MTTLLLFDGFEDMLYATGMTHTNYMTFILDLFVGL